MKAFMKKLEGMMGIGGIRKDIVLLVISGAALLVSIFHIIPLPFDAAWVAVILCGNDILHKSVHPLRQN